MVDKLTSEERGTFVEFSRDLDALATRYAKLKEYVMHRHECDMLWSDGGRPCTCGLAALLN